MNTNDGASTSAEYVSVNINLTKEVDRALESRLFIRISSHQCPIVFHENYDVSFFGLEKCHPFDSGKWGRVFKYLEGWGLLSTRSIIKPNEATKDDLMIVHSKKYLNSLLVPCVLANVIEVPTLCLIPACITDRYFLKPMRLQTGGTVAACRVALDRNWAINIGGGFHHASSEHGGGFCVYADISLAIKILFSLKLIGKVMIVDLDAHQGNGHETDFADDARVFILDMFNPSIYPKDRKSQLTISRPITVGRRTTDKDYLRLLQQNLDDALGEFSADILVYNAGTDCLQGDPLGGMSLTENGVIARDEVVFRVARAHSTPVVMVLSGGYQRDNASVIANSIRNLHDKELIHLLS